MNNLLGKGKEEAKKALKKKILMWIAGLIAPAIPFILLALAILAVIGALLGPVVMAKDVSSSNNTNENVGFFKKFSNFLSGNGWTSDEKAFWIILENSNLDCRKSTLVTATIMYYYQVNLNENLEFGQKPIDENYQTQEETTTTEEQENTAEEITTNIDDEMYSDVPYGQLLPDLKRLVKKMKKGNTEYEKYVKETFLKQSPYNKLLEGYSDEQKRIDDIFEEMKIISNTIECVSSNSYGSATCSFDVEGGTATNLKVRLLKCGNLDSDYSPLENEELIDFEKYITGVVYQEVGENTHIEALKAQAIAARSYALTRGEHKDAGIGDIVNENGQWIISLRACTADQVYCDPDKGCWSYVKGGQTGKRVTVDASVYSGFDPSIHDRAMTKGIWGAPPLPEDSIIRQAVNETAGQVLVDSDQKIVYTEYKDSSQTNWNNLANAQKPKDHFEILKDTYGEFATDIASNCTLVNGAAVGDFTNWKQCDPQWKNVTLGKTTVCDVGCLVTSVAIQMAGSGTQINIENFNPGTFVDHLSNNNGFVGNNFNWTGWQDIAPNFQLVNRNITLTGSKKNKINQIREQINKGYYVVITVKPDWGHWVAVNYLTEDEIYIFDPSLKNTTGKTFAFYVESNVTRMAVFKKTD